MPADAIVPGVLRTGDLGLLTVVLAPRPLLLEGLIDGRDRRAGADRVERTYAVARSAYKDAGAADALRTAAEPSADGAAPWLLTVLRR